jgi:hypothetical protein
VRKKRAFAKESDRCREGPEWLFAWSRNRPVKPSAPGSKSWGMTKPNMRRAFGNQWLGSHTGIRSAPRQINIVLMPSFWITKNVVGFRYVLELLGG